MATYYINSGNCSSWQPNHGYSIGDRCNPRITSGSYGKTYTFECTTGGTSHASTEPTWPYSAGDTVNDNGIVWTCRAPTSWANAHSCLDMMLMTGWLVTAGDIFLVHKTHSENSGSDASGYFPYGQGTNSNAIVCYCVDKDNSNALATGAVVAFGKDKNIYGNIVFVNIKISTAYSMWLTMTSGGVFTLVGATMPLTLLELTGATNYLSGAGSGNGSVLLFQNCNISLANAANYIGYNRLYWRKGALIAPNGSTALFRTSSYLKDLEIQDVDLTAVGTGKLFQVSGTAGLCRAVLTRCKLPSDLGGVTATAYDGAGYQDKILLHHCSSANRTWDFQEVSAEGVVTPETTIVRTGGASDGAQAISWKMVATAALSKFQMGLSSPVIHLWNSSTSQMTVTVHGIWDSASNLKKDEVWIEVEYPADTSSGLGTIATSRVIYAPADTPADLTTSTETWGGSMSNPNKFKMAVTFTPAKAGPIAVRVYVVKPSTTLYICPKVVIS